MYQVSHQKKFNKAGLFFILLVVSVMALGFYGCQFLQPKTEPVSVDDSMPLDRRIGLLKSLGGVKTSNQGTHVLQLDDGNTILLKSLQLNLDDPKYLTKTVEVRGLLTYTTDRKQMVEVMNIDLVQEEAALSAQAVSWKDYAGKSLGIEIKYRDDLVLGDQTDGIVSFSRQIEPETLTMETVETSQLKLPVHEMTIARKLLGEGETALSSLGVKKDDQGDLLAAGLSRSKIGSGNYDALKKADGGLINYYIEVGGYLYTIKIDCGSDEKTLADQNLFYEMLGTLKIAGVAGVAGTEDVKPTQEEDVNNEPTVEPGAEPELKVVKTQEIAEPAAVKPESATRATVEGDSAVSSATQESQEAPSGFTTMDSESFKFSIQYPKSWYYSGSGSTETNVIRHYEFGTKPLEETPGSVTLDLMSGSVPGGTVSDVNGNSVTTVSSDGTVNLYVKGSGSRIYKISGPSSQESTLLQIAGSVKD